MCCGEIRTYDQIDKVLKPLGRPDLLPLVKEIIFYYKTKGISYLAQILPINRTTTLQCFIPSLCGVGPYQFYALADLGCTREAITSYLLIV